MCPRPPRRLRVALCDTTFTGKAIDPQVKAAVHRAGAMLAALGANVREAFLLSQVDGMPYKRIAAQLGVSEVTVRRYIAKAAEHCMIYSLTHGQ